jgi:hypothetical protein
MSTVSISGRALELNIARSADFMELSDLGERTKYPEVLSVIIDRSISMQGMKSRALRMVVASNQNAANADLDRIIGMNGRDLNSSLFAIVAAHPNTSGELEGKILDIITPHMNRQFNFETLLAITKNGNTRDDELRRIISGIGFNIAAFLTRDPELMEVAAGNPNIGSETLLGSGMLVYTVLSFHPIGRDTFDGFWTALANADSASKELLRAIPAWMTSDVARKAIDERLEKL